MAKKTDWMAKLSTLEGAVTERRDVHSTVIQTASPSLNFTYGHGWGLPLGFNMILYGSPGGGKSLICNMMAAGVHRDYSDGFVIKFNTEFREEAQTDAGLVKALGIDMDRYMGINANHPALIYDQIEKQVAAWCQEGMNLKLVIIDSLNSVQGRRALETDSVVKASIGDVAAVNKEGLKRILPIQRKHGFSVVMTSHVAIEMDPWEIKRNAGSPYKNGASVGVQHNAEYSMLVESNRNKDAREDLLGNQFLDTNLKDVADSNKGEETAKKIKVCMKKSSFGVKGRNGEFTLDYKHGIINTHEEVFLLATRRGVVERPNATAYVVGERKWTGKEAFLTALKEDTDLQKQLLKELQRRDLDGQMASYDAEDAKTNAAEESA